MPLCWPLAVPPEDRLLPDAPGHFGEARRHDVHTGVDLYCEPGTAAVAMEAGVVVAIEPFTGAWCPEPDASPWWNDTAVVLVRGTSGVLAYGEVTPGAICVVVGEAVEAGQRLGVVELPVLRHFKGRPTVMLHLERYTDLDPAPGVRAQTVWWPRGTPRPERLLDPTELLLPLAARTFCLEEYDGQRFRQR